MANTAVCSARNNIIFDPYPSVVDPRNSNFLALDPSVCDEIDSLSHMYYLVLMQSKNFDFVKKILKVIIDCRQAAIVRNNTS